MTTFPAGEQTRKGCQQWIEWPDFPGCCCGPFVLPGLFSIAA